MRYIEVPDAHYDPKWRDISLSCAESVSRTAQENDADFIVLPGDFFNRPLIATDRGGINDARAIIKSWTRICPVVAIEGTARHDGAGCYNFLEDCGLVLLKPNRVYGLLGFIDKTTGINKSKISDISCGYFSEQTLHAILFGIPELSKQYILSQLSLSAEQANAEVERQLAQYVDEYIAPMRLKYKDIPAILLYHGAFTDVESRGNMLDILETKSDIIANSSMFENAGLTRISLGHWHFPKEFKKICAGYAGNTGVDDNPWGKTGFVPAMNLVEIHDDREMGLDDGVSPFRVEIKRIPYGTPERRKIFSPLASYDPNIAYWLHSKDRGAVITGGHAWSRVTTEPEKHETQRAIVESNKLTDLFRAIDPNVSKSVLSKVESLQAEHSAPQFPVSVSVDYLTIKGASFWHGKEITLKINELPTGLSLLMGENGSGKSSLFAFASPYPVVIGKDTKSGRPSAIKDFFTEPDSSIEKNLTVNEEFHRHLVTIKGAHTQNPKVECYLYINNFNQLSTTSFDEMFAKCEELYGPFADYLLTTFYVQPLQGKSGSSLMSAGMTDIRNLVQSIAGVDRETEKRYALDMLAEFEKKLADTTAWITGAEEFAVDVDKLNADKGVAQLGCTSKETALATTFLLCKTAKAERDAIAARKVASDAELKQKSKDENRLSEISDSIFTLQENITDLNNLVEQLPTMRSNMTLIEAREKIAADNRERKNKYDAELNTYNTELFRIQDEINRKNNSLRNEYDKNKRTYDSVVAKLEREKENQKAIIERNNKPCFNCGKIPPDAEEAIRLAVATGNEIDEKLSTLTIPIEPQYATIPSTLSRPRPVEPQYQSARKYDGPDKSTLQASIEKAIAAESTIAAKQEEIEKLNSESLVLSEKTYNIIEGISNELQAAESNYNKLQTQYADEKSQIAALRESIKNIETQLKDAATKSDEIAKRKSEIPVFESEITDWKYISMMLQANKIPALELESVIGTIDAEATRILEPFLDGVLSFETLTQTEGKKGAIDKFDIIVHNNATGQSQSFITFSPGVKAFLSDAYVKALVMVRNNRQHRHYSPIISDEADGPIQPERVAAYYEMQSAYYAGTEDRVLVVSHAPDAHNYVQNHVEVKELLK